MYKRILCVYYRKSDELTPKRTFPGKPSNYDCRAISRRTKSGAPHIPAAKYIPCRFMSVHSAGIDILFGALRSLSLRYALIAYISCRPDHDHLPALWETHSDTAAVPSKWKCARFSERHCRKNRKCENWKTEYFLQPVREDSNVKNKKFIHHVWSKYLNTKRKNTSRLRETFSCFFM